jgi:hypothetical protein
MHNNSFFKSILFLASILLFVSCDKEYSTVGDALIGDNNFDLTSATYSVVAYNEKITPIQSDNLAINALGIYDNVAFGKTTANFATQLIMASPNPTIDSALKQDIESVYLDVPYFVDADSTVAIAAGGNTYVLDSIYGKKLAKIKLSIYESGRYMGVQNTIPQMFYTNQNTEFNSYIIGSRLNDLITPENEQNDAFFFDPAQHSVTTKDAAGKDVITYSAPSMRLKLNADFFKNKIINAPAGSLASNDVFINYFKGLYFKVEQSGTDAGSLAMINFAKGTITIKYKEDTSATDATKVDKSIVLNMIGNTSSLLEQSNTNSAYESATTNSNSILGDDKLYLKGGEGSLAVLDLFDKTDVKGWNKVTEAFVTGANGISDELEDMRHPADGKKILINEANLVFNIDASTMLNGDKTDSYEPDRIYLYDLTNNRPVIDYYIDGSAAIRPKMAKLVFDGNINRDLTSTTTPKRGLTYKIRITNHIRNLIKYDDSTNVKLGVVVTENIAIADSYKLKSPTAKISQAPKASVMNPLGTIIYGSKSTVPVDKRLKLEIYYTKPN